MKKIIPILFVFAAGFGLALLYQLLAHPKTVRAQWSNECIAWIPDNPRCGDSGTCGQGTYTVTAASATGEGVMSHIQKQVPCDGTSCDDAIVPWSEENSSFCCDRDQDGYTGSHPGCPSPASDCNDTPGAGYSIHPGAHEGGYSDDDTYCHDGIDNDCDGLTDCQESACHGGAEVCDGIDNNCDGNVDENTCCDYGDPPIGDAPYGDYYYWCRNCWAYIGTYTCDPGTPVLIDVEGDGFALTDAASGVNFNLTGTGSHQYSWTVPGSDDGWLVLDRNNNGLIDDGKEMFGNVTAQSTPPAGESPNGFLALKEFDKEKNGGNGDGMISSADTAFSKLRVWQDRNHDGISEPDELMSLNSVGITSLDLSYKVSKRTDEYGNQFRYRAKASDKKHADVGRWAWDVILVPK
jgi:hypothetical protein